MIFRDLLIGYYYGKASSRFNRKEYLEPLNFILKAINVGPDCDSDITYADNLFFAARCYFQLGRYSDAMKCASDGLSIYHNLKGDTSFLKGDILKIELFIENIKRRTSDLPN